MKILIVDDERRIRSLLTEYFEYKGWEVTTAQDGEEAISALRSQSFDVVLSDIRMPGVSGLEVLAETRRRCPSTQILLMTGYRDLQSAIEAVNQGAFAYVEKPFDIHELHERALEAFEAKHLSDQAEQEMANLKELVEEKNQELSLLKERSKAILGVMPSMLLLVNEHGRIRDINDLFLKVFGWYRGDLLDKHLCHGLRCPLSQGGPCPGPCDLWGRLMNVVSTGYPCVRLIINPAFGRSLHAKHPSYQISILPLPASENAGRAPREFLITMEDVSRDRALEMQMLRASRLASLGEMATGIVHELTQPLNTISARAQLLRLRLERERGLKPEAVHEALGEVVEQVFRIAEILQHLRSYVTPEAGASGFSPADLLEGSLKLLKAQFKAWGISVSVHAAEPMFKIRGRFKDLQHALTNILLNARDALKDYGQGEGAVPGKKEIRIGLRSFMRSGAPFVCIEITDNGPGMPPLVLEKAFDPLFSTKSGGQGSGMGLPIAASILHEHGGYIGIQSEPGGGTRVRLEIPASGDSESNP